MEQKRPDHLAGVVDCSHMDHHEDSDDVATAAGRAQRRRENAAMTAQLASGGPRGKEGNQMKILEESRTRGISLTTMMAITTVSMLLYIVPVFAQSMPCERENQKLLRLSQDPNNLDTNALYRASQKAVECAIRELKRTRHNYTGTQRHQVEEQIKALEQNLESIKQGVRDTSNRRF